MSGPGRDHGASSPAALSRAQYASSSSTVRVVWTAIACLLLLLTRILAEHATLPAVEADRDPLPHLGRLAGIELDAHPCAVAERHVAIDEVTEERHLGDL